VLSGLIGSLLSYKDGSFIVDSKVQETASTCIIVGCFTEACSRWWL